MEARSYEFQVYAGDRIEIERVPALRVTERVGFCLHFCQPSSEPTGGSAAWHKPCLTRVTPPGAGKTFPEPLHSHSVEQKADIGTGFSVVFSRPLDVVWCSFVAHGYYNARLPVRFPIKLSRCANA